MRATSNQVDRPNGQHARHFDVVVVGAGPGGIFFAHEYLRQCPGGRIALVDAGHSIGRRTCPLVQKGRCTRCETCHAVYGFGGAGMYSDGKLSLFPAGKGLLRLVPDEQELNALNEYVLRHILDAIPCHDHTRNTDPENAGDGGLSSLVSRHQLDLKAYEVYHVGTEGVQEACASIERRLIAEGLTLLDRTKVIDVEKFGDVFALTAKSGRNQHVRLSARKVVFATGKASGLLARDIFSRLGVESSNNTIDLGVRVEAASEALDNITGCHLDAKIKEQCRDGSEVRTFCMCRGGYLVSCWYDTFGSDQKICTIDGFTWRDRKSANANFGLLVRRRFPSPLDGLRMQLEIVRAINRAAGESGTVVQRLGDFLERRPTTREALAANSVVSTLGEATPTDLRWMLPSYVVDNIEGFLRKLGGVSSNLLSPDTLLHAPVWEACHDAIALGPACETSVPGLYIVGDATGLARGIVQAGTMGIIAARDCAEVDR